MPRIPLCLPNPGENLIADEIRKRRHPRDLIALDGILLNNPSLASGWNSLLGAIRSHNSLPADLRELLILRVAALNSAAYEWSQHEKVGRTAGLTTPQLLRIRDTVKPLDTGKDKSNYSISDAHLAAIAFADGVTRGLQVSDRDLGHFKNQLALLGTGTQVDRLLFDATATVAGYNMVSRVLVTLDVADDHNQSVAIPGLESTMSSLRMSDGTQLAVCRQESTGSRPWLMLCNSLLTNMKMWDWITPSLGANYNLLRFDQRGHGQSDVPACPCSIDQLADDVSEIVNQLGIPTPLHGLIGVSQGGATALSVSTRHPDLFRHYIVCDTQPRSPAGNKEAWQSRIAMAEGTQDGLVRLSEATVGRWFPIESHLNQPGNPTCIAVRQMIEGTSVEGFKAGAASLYNYTIDEELVGANGQKLLLLAGGRDGGLPKVLEELSSRLKQAGKQIEFVCIPGAGHLPMVDQPFKFLNLVEHFLAGGAC